MFTVRAQYNRREGGHSDTSDTPRSVPTYHFADLFTFRLPLGCRLVGVEITDEAIDLPRFRHPTRAAYVFGAERYSLSPQMLSLCEFVVKIPTRFSINVGMAGAIVLYDRLLSSGKFGDRPVVPGGKPGLRSRLHTAPLLKQLGPGLITGAADDDPSGIATYSQGGAQFGFNLLWTLPLTFP